jgi:hypothetical protein
MRPVTGTVSCVENEVKFTEAEAAIWQTHQVQKIFNNQRTAEASLEKLEKKLNTPMSEAKILSWKEKSKKYA